MNVTAEQVLEELTRCVGGEVAAAVEVTPELPSRLAELAEAHFDTGDNHGGTLLYELATAVDRYLRWRHWELTGG